MKHLKSYNQLNESSQLTYLGVPRDFMQYIQRNFNLNISHVPVKLEPGIINTKEDIFKFINVRRNVCLLQINKEIHKYFFIYNNEKYSYGRIILKTDENDEILDQKFYTHTLDKIKQDLKLFSFPNKNKFDEYYVIPVEEVQEWRKSRDESKKEHKMVNDFADFFITYHDPVLRNALKKEWFKLKEALYMLIEEYSNAIEDITETKTKEFTNNINHLTQYINNISDVMKSGIAYKNQHSDALEFHYPIDFSLHMYSKDKQFNSAYDLLKSTSFDKLSVEISYKIVREIKRKINKWLAECIGHLYKYQKNLLDTDINRFNELKEIVGRHMRNIEDAIHPRIKEENPWLAAGKELDLI